MAASPDILREALLRLAFTNGCREAVEQEFLVQSTFERLSLGEPNHQASRSSSTKRRRYETCARCTKEYDVTKNDAGACRWHGGRPLFSDPFPIRRADVHRVVGC